MPTSQKSQKSQKSQMSQMSQMSLQESMSSENRALAVSREVLQRLGRDHVLVDRLVEEMEASMASVLADAARGSGPAGASNPVNAIEGMGGPDGVGGTGGPDGQDGPDGLEEGRRRATVKVLLEQFLRQRDGANLTRTTSGSNLLGELKQCLDLESMVVRRCWEMMEEEWFDDILKNTAA